MELKDIKQWQVKDGRAVAVNPINPSKDCIVSESGLIENLDRSLTRQIAFTVFNAWASNPANQPHTNAPDGIYDASDFGDLVWQCYDNDVKQWQDANQSKKVTWEQFNAYFHTTRKFLPLKAVVKEEKEVSTCVNLLDVQNLLKCEMSDLKKWEALYQACTTTQTNPYTLLIAQLNQLTNKLTNLPVLTY
ncbi:MAG: hypothetical protein ABIN91_11175 [Mucilaginibacter sp.]|uniref:hypothetical protein n=1 Tax=Mucilaginibacter sp. TaxID=1882438 RepID=UPI003263A213